MRVASPEAYSLGAAAAQVAACGGGLSSARTVKASRPSCLRVLTA